MFVVLLTFAHNKSQAGQWMQAHNAWLAKGFDDGVFLLAGSLQPNRGGSIVAEGCSRSELEQRVNDDPFVQAQVVNAEILEITPARTDPRLSFLMH